jgi:hypothetical protein
MLQRAASNAYSWWWASHIRTKQSKWLDNHLQGNVHLLFPLHIVYISMNPSWILEISHISKVKYASLESV